MPWIDPIVAEVRQTRESLSAALDFDVHAIFADLRARQVGVGNRLVRVQRAVVNDEQRCADEMPEPAQAR